MSRAPILLLALLLGVPACDGGRQEGRARPSPSPPPQATESPVETGEYLQLPGPDGADRIEVTGSCESGGPDFPILNAYLANGGTLQLARPGEGILHVSALPSPEADPVGTRVPADTTWTEVDGLVAGSSVLWLGDTQNRIVVEFRVRWDESVAPCPTEPPTGAAAAPVVPEHGGTYWAVYLAAGDEPDLEDAIAYLEERLGPGFYEGFSSVECDEGARKALGPGAGPLTVAAYFDTEEDARVWAETLPAPPPAIAEVRTFCLD